MKVAHFLPLSHLVNVTLSYQPHDSAGESKHRCYLSFKNKREEIWGHAFLVKMTSAWNLKLRYLQTCASAEALPHTIAHCFTLTAQIRIVSYNFLYLFIKIGFALVFIHSSYSQNLHVYWLSIVYRIWCKLKKGSKLHAAGFRFPESKSAPEIFFALLFSSLSRVMPKLERDRGEPTAALLPFNSHQISSRAACFVHHSFTLLFINIINQPDCVSITVLFMFRRARVL